MASWPAGEIRKAKAWAVEVGSKKPVSEKSQLVWLQLIERRDLLLIQLLNSRSEDSLMEFIYLMRRDRYGNKFDEALCRGA
jgi:hypothetical protein